MAGARRRTRRSSAPTSTRRPGSTPATTPSTDPAPGRDDNGSGLAAVLTLAQHFRRLAGKLTHTVRFCFFNAEEAGLVGSKAYAAAAQGPARTRAGGVLHGHDRLQLRQQPDLRAACRLHRPGDPRPQRAAGHSRSPRPRRRPARCFRRRCTAAPGYSGAPDRTVFDGAINRSDHAAFQQQGWGAVLASEDFFANLPTEPAPDANPNYHRSADQTIDTVVRSGDHLRRRPRRHPGRAVASARAQNLDTETPGRPVLAWQRRRPRDAQCAQTDRPGRSDELGETYAGPVVLEASIRLAPCRNLRQPLSEMPPSSDRVSANRGEMVR